MKNLADLLHSRLHGATTGGIGCHLPFGITPAPELFQMKLDQNLEGLRCDFKIASNENVLQSQKTK